MWFDVVCGERSVWTVPSSRASLAQHRYRFLAHLLAQRRALTGPSRRDRRHCCQFVAVRHIGGFQFDWDAAQTRSLLAERLVFSSFVSNHDYRWRQKREWITERDNLTVERRRRRRRNDPSSQRNAFPRAALVKLIQRIQRGARSSGSSSQPAVNHAGATRSRRATEHVSRDYHPQIRGSK